MGTIDWMKVLEIVAPIVATLGLTALHTRGWKMPIVERLLNLVIGGPKPPVDPNAPQPAPSPSPLVPGPPPSPSAHPLIDMLRNLVNAQRSLPQVSQRGNEFVISMPATPPAPAASVMPKAGDPAP
jgi:hypothetical protein